MREPAAPGSRTICSAATTSRVAHAVVGRHLGPSYVPPRAECLAPVVDPNPSDRADEVFWNSQRALVDLYRAAAYHRPAIWLANDWTTLPVAQRLAEEQNVPFGYDTHELATSEYGHRAKWRILYRPLILALERRGIARASVVSCVSDGIADHLHRLYRMEQRPMVIRNMPHYDPCALRPTQSSIRVLYHGIVASGRGLEACISSVAHWVEGRSLAIRGPVQDSYRAELEALIAATGVEDRVTLLPPVPMIDLIERPPPSISASSSFLLPTNTTLMFFPTRSSSM